MRGDPSGYTSDFDPAGSTYKAWFEGGWKNDEMTTLLNDALGNPDQAKRHDQYRRMQEIALTDLDKVQGYNVLVKRFPTNLYATAFSFAPAISPAPCRHSRKRWPSTRILKTRASAWLRARL